MSRQRRSFSTGRYEQKSHCVCCGRVVQDDYFSHPLTDSVGADGELFHDEAICLCEWCMEAVQHVRTVSVFRLRQKIIVGLKGRAKAYFGDRGSGQPLVFRFRKCLKPMPLPLRHDLRNHSQEFSWGYMGSGPSQLALAICADALGDRDAQGVYQDFKRAFVARWETPDSWQVTSEEICEWADAVKKLNL
jgi:hypothetical protein